MSSKVSTAEGQAQADPENPPSIVREHEQEHADKAPGADAPPLDIFGDDTISGLPELPRDSLPPVIEKFSRDEAERLGVDPGMVALPALAVCAAAVPDTIELRVKRHDNWREQARLWIAVVADPAQKKTPAINRAMKPLQQLDTDWSRADAPALRDWEIRIEYWRKLKTKLMRDAAKAEIEPEAIAERITAAPARPRLRRKVIQDTTTEALGVILADNPDGVLVYQDELSGWIGAMDAYHSGRGGKDRGRGGKDRALWLSAWNGGPQHVDRIGRGSLFIPNWSASIVGGIQPDRLRAMSANLQEDGLLQRFIVVYGEHAGAEVDRPPDAEAGNHYRAVVGMLAELEPVEAVAEIVYDADAQAVQERVFTLVNGLLAAPELSPSLRAHLGKWSGMFARIALTFHAVECIDGGGKIRPQISGGTAERAYRLFAGYLLPHAMRFYDDVLAAGETLIHARWIAGYILARKSPSITCRDIGRAYREIRGDEDAIRAAMAVLEHAGWVVPNAAPPGKKTKKWIVRPECHQTFAPRAEAERQRRDAQKAKIAEAAELRRELKTSQTSHAHA